MRPPNAGILRREPLASIDARVTRWMARHGLGLLRVSLGLVFLWFGLLKFFAGVSPAEDLARRTLESLLPGLLAPGDWLTVLAAWETLIGLGLVTGLYLRVTLLLLWLQMIGAVLPLVLLTDVTFAHAPWVPTLAGQYVIKNIVLVSAGIVLGATVRGGRLEADGGPAGGAEHDSR